MDEPRWGRPLPAKAISLDPEDLRQAAASLDPGEDPERAWVRYLRALALLALRRWLKQRGASVVVGPDLEPEAPDRLLAIEGLATQLLCASSLVEEVLVPLGPWNQEVTAPQLALLALVDEENGVVEFPGVMDAAAVITEVQKLRSTDLEAIELPVYRFSGGLERLLRWVSLMEPEALPRAGLVDSNSEEADDPLAGLQQWLAQLLSSSALMPLPVLGTRGGTVPPLRLISPQVRLAENGLTFAEAVCDTPSIWADTALAEVLIEKDGVVVWQILATRQRPIEGPIAWPSDPLLPRERLTLRLRPFGAPGGIFATLSLVAPDALVMQKGEEAIEHLRLAWKKKDVMRIEHGPIAVQACARQWLATILQLSQDVIHER
ncbi:MAG: hypothetical protein VKN15_03315 [Cyanobacteriota bacterium]|nr:hypothetical protein [Cyanobacteriota bacterium]